VSESKRQKAISDTGNSVAVNSHVELSAALQSVYLNIPVNSAFTMFLRIFADGAIRKSGYAGFFNRDP